MSAWPQPHAPRTPRGKTAQRREPRESAVARIISYECCPGDDSPVRSILQAEGYDVVFCHSGETLLEAAVEGPAHAVLFQIKPECQADMGLLHLLRRVTPATPLILIASESSLETQRLVQELRPMYYAISPVDPDELSEALRSAIRQNGRPANRKT